ncbi:Bone morphogenetic protein receptor type-2 [Mactra antiquata]
MWINCLIFIGYFTACLVVTVRGDDDSYCAYKNDYFVLNETSTGTPGKGYHKLMKTLRNDRKKTPVLINGYEKCDPLKNDRNGNQCFSLWVRQNDTSTPVSVFSGCWISARKRNCQTTKCVTPSNWQPGSKHLFCCCTGNKCNGNDETSTNKDREPVVYTTSAPVLSKPAKEVQPVPYKKENPKGKPTLCAHKLENQAEGQNIGNDIGGSSGIRILDNDTIECDVGDGCFTYYTVDPSDRSKIKISFQGCWTDSDNKNKCNYSECVQRPVEQRNNSHFCCCHGDMCNNNISKNNGQVIRRTTTVSSGPDSRPMRDPTYKQRTIVISLLSVLSLAVIILASYFIYRFCIRPPVIPTNVNDGDDPSQYPTFNIDDLKISCLITKGRFSEVWKGSLNDQDVAVKIYSPSYRQYYLNEKYIYSLPHMEHENIMKFFGGEERILQDGNIQHLLVLQYVPDGTLMNYLKNNVIDWYTMCKMCLTLARGLAHLHADMGSGDDFKPTVAHRDINSRNVLVKPDLSCVIADLGFCMSTMGSKLILKGHTENAEQTSLIDVGTLRYMAPELLDGAVNLRDCEASLKQIDMYAFGLVMWEISSRCSDLYQGCPMPEFTLPYSAELGSHPTFEEMQINVSRNKIRPKFPEVWKDYNQAIRALKETIEESWDHDAEARLTALCVEERVLEMKMLWSQDNRNKGNKGVTPTVNTALLAQSSVANRPGYHGSGHTQWSCMNSNTESTSSNIADGSSSALIINDIRNSTTMLSNHSESSSTLPQTWGGELHGSFSTSTMESTLPATPSDSVPCHPKSQNINAMMNQPLPAHQGRNPTVERNTHKRSDEELAVVGNNLFYGKDCPPEGQGGGSENIFDSFTDSLESSLMQNDALNQGRASDNTYVQGRRQNICGTNELPPKVVNNPMDRPDNITTANTVSNVANTQVSAVPKSKKAKEMGLLSHLALLGRLAFSGKYDSKKTVNDNENQSPICMENGRLYDSIGRHNPIFERSQTLETEVRLTNTGPVVRPSVYQAKPSNIVNIETASSNVSKDSLSDNVDLESVDSSEADTQSNSPLISRHRVAPYSKSTSDLSPQKTNRYNKLDDETKLARPSTLSLKGHNYDKSRTGSLNSLSKIKGVIGQKNGKSASAKKSHLNGYKTTDKSASSKVKPSAVMDESEKIKLRNKTPVSDKNGRYSLHDDRLMSQNGKSAKDSSGEWKSSVSLQQFKSINENDAGNVYTDCTC